MHKTKKRKVFGQRRAQAVMELAIFGAVFIFLLTALINKSLSISYQQNIHLKAMRLSLAISYRFTHELYPPSNSRNQGALYIIEDRLTAGAGKFGNFDRAPYMTSGAGALTKNLFLPTDWGEEHNLPRIDFFINGRHVALTTAAFNSYTFTAEQAASGNYGMYRIVINHPSMDISPGVPCLVHPAAAANGVTSNTCNCVGSGFSWPGGGFGKCVWGWQEVQGEDIEIMKNYDVDGDLHTEQVMGYTKTIFYTGREWSITSSYGTMNYAGTSYSLDVPDDRYEYYVSAINVIDSQNGHIDVTDRDEGPDRQGIDMDVEMHSHHVGSLQQGPYTPPNKSGTQDIITRRIRLNPRRTSNPAVGGSGSTEGCSAITGDICEVETIITID